MRILVVDDDIGLTQLLQLVFESRGFGVTIAHNGEQALESLERELPEAILLDLMMPGISGLEVCKQVRSAPHTANIPIVILTARYDMQTRQDAMQAGATEYLTKPVRPTELINRMRKVAINSASPTAKVLT